MNSEELKTTTGEGGASHIICFIKQLRSDEPTRLRLGEALQHTPEADITATVIAFARAEGWTVSPEDIQEISEQLAAHKSSAGELADGELEEVSGGVFGAGAATIVFGIAEGATGLSRRIKSDNQYFDPSKRAFWLGF